MSFTSVYINDKSVHTIKVHDRDELIEVVQKEIDKNGYDADLNHIDVSEITDFYGIFENSEFIGDISNWDVSNGVVFSHMFVNSKFNSSLLRWNVSNGKYFSEMFRNSEFNQDICLWNMRNAVKTNHMFYDSPFYQDINMWEFDNLVDASYMFAWSPYNQTKNFGNKNFDKHEKPVHKICLDKWNLGSCIIDDMFICSQYIEPDWSKYRSAYLFKAYNEMNSGKFEWKCNSYEGMTLDNLKKLSTGRHSVYLDRKTGEILGHDNESGSIELLYSFSIKENMSDDAYNDLFKKIQNAEKKKLQCVYLTTLSKIYPYDFIKSMSPWIVRYNPYKNNKYVQLYLLKQVNWHAKKLGFPTVVRTSNNCLELVN